MYTENEQDWSKSLLGFSGVSNGKKKKKKKIVG